MYYTNPRPWKRMQHSGCHLRASMPSVLVVLGSISAQGLGLTSGSVQTAPTFAVAAITGLGVAIAHQLSFS